MEFRERTISNDNLIKLTLSPYEIAVLIYEAGNNLKTLNDCIRLPFKSEEEAVNYLKNASQDAYNLSSIINKLYGNLSKSESLKDEEVSFTTYEIKACINTLYICILRMNFDDMSVERSLHDVTIIYLYNLFKEKYLTYCLDNKLQDEIGVNSLPSSRCFDAISNYYIAEYRDMKLDEKFSKKTLELNNDFLRTRDDIDELIELIHGIYDNEECIMPAKEYILEKISEVI